MNERERCVNGYDVIQNWCRTRRPDCAFEGRTLADFRRWRDAFRRRYRGCLGAWPEKTPLRATVTAAEDRGDHIRKRVLYDSSSGVTVPAFLLEPKGLSRGERRPAILAAHGHGAGKMDVVGATAELGTKAQLQTAQRLQYAYGLDAVRRGYIVIAPDFMPFGERRPPEEWSRSTRDACNITDLAWQYFGHPLITQNIWDGMRAVDVLLKLPNVDARRIGVIGLSFGGTMATHLLINDRRIRAGVVSGYVSTVRGDALNMRGKGNTCGAQHVPRLLLYGDIADMLGLAAPKPVLFETGRKETCFHFPDMDRACRHVRSIYRAAGYADRIARDIHPNDHQWSGKKAWSWLGKWL